MRKIIYAFGIATFLAMFIFTIATSLTNPFYGMSTEVLAKAPILMTTADCDVSCVKAAYDDECIIRNEAGTPIKKCIGWKPKPDPV